MFFIVSHIFFRQETKFAKNSKSAIITSSKNFILDVGMEKEQKQELQWRASVLPIPAFHCILCTTHSGGMQEWIIQIPSIAILLFPSLHLKYFRIKFLLLVCSFYVHVQTTPTSVYRRRRRALNEFVVREVSLHSIQAACM